MSDFLYCSRKVVTTVDDFDFKEKIKPSAIMEYFQDMATVHASEIGIGYEEMKAKNLCWVLNRLSAVIYKNPLVGEEIILTTFPHKPGVVDAVRDYYIFSSAGENLIRGTSRWCVLDISNKAIRRCAPLFDYSDDRYNPEYAVSDGNAQLPDLYSVLGESLAPFCGQANITDLDRNGHVNNARYGDIIINSCDYGYYASHNIKSFDINFLTEMKIGNKYCVNMKMCENETFFEASGDTKRNPIFRAKITWQ